MSSRAPHKKAFKHIKVNDIIRYKGRVYFVEQKDDQYNTLLLVLISRNNKQETSQVIQCTPNQKLIYLGRGACGYDLHPNMWISKNLSVTDVKVLVTIKTNDSGDTINKLLDYYEFVDFNTI